MHGFFRIYAFSIIVAMAGSSVHAEPPPGEVSERDAPSRAARLSLMEGSVSFRAAGVDTWAAGTLNRPVTVNDQVWADADSRAEVHLGSSAIRLSSRTRVAITNLDGHTLQVSVSEGAVGVRVREMSKGELIEVDTPAAAVTLQKPGAYRITVDPNTNEVDVEVRQGAAEVLASGEAFAVPPQQWATITGEAGKTTHNLRAEPPADAFDAWCDARDKREDDPPALQYVSRNTVGYEDLDAYGTWQNTPDYGPVWTPQDVDPGWAPYQNGLWSWVDPWGWSWIDFAVWGYAPSHYGRWVNWGSRWRWAPGPLVSSPFYAPALVGFIGSNNMYRRGYGEPWAGWFPLGWNEAYVPGYYASYHYVQQLNANVVNVRRLDLANIHHTQIYTNRSVPGAVTTVSASTIQGARPVALNRVQVPSSFVNEAPVTGFTAPVAPKSGSVIAAGTTRAVPPAENMNRGMVTRHAPAAASVAFANREADLARTAGRPMVNAYNGTGFGGGGHGPLRPTTPGPYTHPAAPVAHGPALIGPHPAPARFRAPTVQYVGQPERSEGASVYRVQQPPRYEGGWQGRRANSYEGRPVYNSAPRYNAPVPHYNSAPVRGPETHLQEAPHFAPVGRSAPIAPAPHFAAPRGGRR